MFMLDAEPRGAWTPEDKLLALALQTYEDSLCSGCGHPRDEAYDDRAEGEYEAVEHVCQACAARERHARENSGKEKAAVPGQKVSVSHLGPG